MLTFVKWLQVLCGGFIWLILFGFDVEMTWHLRGPAWSILDGGEGKQTHH